MRKRFFITAAGKEYVCRINGSRQDGLYIERQSEANPDKWTRLINFSTYKEDAEGNSWAIKNYSENSPWGDKLIHDLVGAGYATVTGAHPSGFVVMPILKFNEKFWTEMCGDDEENAPRTEPKSALREKKPHFKICPMCNNIHSIMLNQPEEFLVERFENRELGGLVQDVLSFLNPAEREFIMTGYCGNCQMLLFGNKTLLSSPRYK
jgi:hypothetical protein